MCNADGAVQGWWGWDGAQRGDFGGAAELAFEMGQPRRLLAVVETALSSGRRSGGTAVLETLAGASQPD